MKTLLALLIACSPLAATEADDLSKTLGHLLVRHLSDPGFTCNFDQVIAGIRDEQAGKKAPMSEESYEQKILAIQEKVFTETAEKNLAAADAFLKENSAKENVTILTEQLHYTIAKTGAGDEVGPDSMPLIHYKGTLLDGSTFSESAKPIPLPISQSIPGFAKGLVGMKEGEKRTLYIHPELAYGTGGTLPPNSLLIFEVEIVKANSNPFEDCGNNSSTP